MLRYESLLLAIPEITGDEAKNLESQIDKIITKEKGLMLSFERWGKYKLAYPIQKNDYGVYFLTRFEISQGTKAVDDIKTLFVVKLNNIIMRSIFIRLDDKLPLVYQRPKSFEEAPTRDVESFLKENKMAGLLSAVESDKATGKKEAVQKAKTSPE